MKVYILIDENNIVRWMYSEEYNLDKKHEKYPLLTKLKVDFSGTVGDEYNGETDEWTPRPENYPKPKEKDLNEIKIGRKMRKLAIDSLKAEGELPEDYEE